MGDREFNRIFYEASCILQIEEWHAGASTNGIWAPNLLGAMPDDSKERRRGCPVAPSELNTPISNGDLQGAPRDERNPALDI